VNAPGLEKIGNPCFTRRPKCGFIHKMKRRLDGRGSVPKVLDLIGAGSRAVDFIIV
jgi:hypothetical protein